MRAPPVKPASFLERADSVLDRRQSHFYVNIVYSKQLGAYRKQVQDVLFIYFFIYLENWRHITQFTDAERSQCAVRLATLLVSFQPLLDYFLP